MKVLLITNGSVDYLTCMVVHGLYKLLGKDFTHTTDYKVMYTMAEYEKQKLYGKGFTIYGTLSEYLNENSDLEQKIFHKFYDIILIDRFSIENPLTDLALKHYNSSHIAYLDGEDHEYFEQKFYKKIKYFKREKYQEDIHSLPISFSFPEEKISFTKYPKTQILGKNIPGTKDTYIFETENDYYLDYSKSYFGYTTKKGGWDCLRHYEIIANQCIPLFRDLHNCPENCLFNFPKKIIIESNLLYNNLDIEMYEHYQTLIFEHFVNNLTTKHIAKYLIDNIKYKNN